MNLASLPDPPSSSPSNSELESTRLDAIPSGVSPNVKPKPKSGRESQADPNNAAIASAATPPPAPQTSAYLDSLAASLALPITPPVALSVSGTSLPTGSAPILAGTPAAPISSTFDPTLSSTPRESNTVPDTGSVTLYLAPSDLAQLGSDAVGADAFVSPFSIASEPAQSSTPREPHNATASLSVPPFSNTSDSTLPSAPPSASNAMLSSIPQRISTSGIPQLVTNGAPGDPGKATVPVLTYIGLPDHAGTRDASHLHSEPASPVSAPTLPLVPARDAPVAPVTVAVAVIAGSSAAKPTDAASAEISSPSPVNDVLFRVADQVVSPVATSAQTSATTRPKIEQPADPHTGSFAAPTPVRDSMGPAVSQTLADVATSPQTAESGIAALSSSSSASDVASLANRAAANAASEADVNPTPDSSAPDANSPASTAATTGTRDRSKDPATTAQASSSPGVSPPSSPERKSSASSPQATPSATTGSTHDAAANSSLLASAPAQNPSAPASSVAPEKSGSSALPPAHQMLDSAPAVPLNDAVPAPPVAHVNPNAALQIHVGVHTSAFGNVEIRAIVEQSQVGIAIHGDRDLARWFSSEVSGLEAGLKSQHLNLTAVDFASNRSGVHTATSFQQGQARQNFSHTPGSYVAALPSEAVAAEPEDKSDMTAVLPVQAPETRVSILV